MAFKLVLCEEDIQELFVGHMIGMIYPLPQSFSCFSRSLRVFIFSWDQCGNVEGDPRVKWLIAKHPLLLVTTSPNEVHCFASQKDLFRQIMSKQTIWYHHMIQPVTLRPELSVIVLCCTGWSSVLHEKLLEWVIQFPFDHPLSDHGKDWSTYFPQNSSNEYSSWGTPIEDIGVQSWANSTTFQILYRVYNDRKPFHSLHWFLYPEIELSQVKIIWCIKGFPIIVRVLGPLAFQYS